MKKSSIFLVILVMFIAVAAKSQSSVTATPEPVASVTPKPIASPAVPNAPEGSFIFTAQGDFGSNSNTTAGLKLMGRVGASIHLALGDFSYDKISPESVWCKYVRASLGDDKSHFLIVSGNHESDGHDGLIDNFISGFPDTLGVTGEYGKQYFFDYPKDKPLVRFIMISPGLNFTNGGFFSYEKGTDRYQWVSDRVDEARAADIPWTVVGMHLNCLTMVGKPCESGPDIFNLFVEKKVDLVLQAHSHSYERSKQLTFSDACTQIEPEAFNPACVVDEGEDGKYSKGAGTVLLLNAVFGGRVYPINRMDKEAPYFAVAMGENVNPAKGFTKFTVNEKEINAEFIVTTGGKFADSFRISKDT